MGQRFNLALDNAIPNSATSAITYDVNFGAYYNTPEAIYWIISQSPSSAKFGKDKVEFDFQNARHYFLIAGYSFNLGPSLQLMPSVLVKSDAKSHYI